MFIRFLLTLSLTLGAAGWTTAWASESLLECSFATAKTVKETGWAESTWKASTGAVQLAQTAAGETVLAVEVHSQGELVHVPRLRVAAESVYSIQFEGRAVGQIEGISLSLRRASQPFTWHGGDTFPVVREWQTFSTQIRTHYADDDTVLFFTLRGIGSYQLRSVTITSLEHFVLPEDAAPARGELVFNGHFDLGEIGWYFTTPGWGDHRARYYATNDRPDWQINAEGETSFVSSGSIFGFVTPIRPMTLRFGMRYVVRVTGAGADKDADLWFARPGQNIDIIQKVPLTFIDGVATGMYIHRPPQYGAMSARPQSAYFRIEHYAKQPLRIDSVSITEEVDTAEAAQAAEVAEVAEAPALLKPCAGVLIIKGADALGAVHRDTPITVAIRCAGVAEGTAGQVVVADAAGNEIRRLPVTVQAPTDGYAGATVTIADLPLGWLRVFPDFGSAVGSEDAVMVVIPAPLADPVVGFLGSHIQSEDPRQLPHAKAIGIQAARCFEFSWNSIQPKPEAFQFPDGILQRYLDAGVEPMVLLNGTPRWASSAPEEIRTKPDEWAGWNSYPPTDIAVWRAFVSKMATQLRGKVHVYQIWNEPNGYFLKTSKDWGRSIEQTYVDLAREAFTTIKAVDPEATVVVGATAGHAPQFFQRCFELGLLDCADVISYHAYGECQNGLQGAPGFAGPLNEIRTAIRKAGKDLPIWDCESGYNVPNYSDSINFLAGIISRQAAGFGRYYLYSGGPRDFPGQSNFHMLRDVADRPLPTEALIAVYDRLLNGAAYVEDIGDAANRVFAYSFQRRDGQRVIVAWHGHETATVQLPLSTIAGLSAVDAFGNPIPAVNGEGLTLTQEPRYFASDDTFRVLK